MVCLQVRHQNKGSLQKDVQGSALLEFAIVLPLVMVFVVGIFDFSGAFNQKQKIEQAAQEGAIIAGAQPMTDIAQGKANPDSLQPVVIAIFNSLAGSGSVSTAACNPPGTTAHSDPNLKWKYTISSCPDDMIIVVDRGS